MPGGKPDTKFVYLVRSEFGSSEREDEWNEWYDTVHVPDMLSVPGVERAERFAKPDGSGAYVAIYDFASLEVFDEPRYKEVVGWHEWKPDIVNWRRMVLRREEDDETLYGGTSRRK